MVWAFKWDFSLLYDDPAPNKVKSYDDPAPNKVKSCDLMLCFT